MIEGITAPLSPPVSPFHTDFFKIDWLNPSADNCSPSTTTPPPAVDNMAMLHAEVAGLPLDLHNRPHLAMHHKSYSYAGPGMSLQTMNPMDNGSSSPVPTRERISISNIDDVDAPEIPQVNFSGSAPASPNSRLTPPQSNSSDKDESAQDLMDDDIDLDDAEVTKSMTAAELRAHKRKMKRFRLTHNQTRFLMSEFARQAHPDAAHRERLAREIPGLTPRQVQVWFQNRRAKLKRLTSDDRERMMRSRALPDDFDMTQALHSPFGGAATTQNTPIASPNNYVPAFQDTNMVRSLTMDSIRPIGPAFSYTPPHSTTDGMSPISTPDASSFGYPTPQLDGSPRRPNPFMASPTSNPNFTSHPAAIPRLQLQERIGRARSESLNALKASLSYQGESSIPANHAADGQNAFGLNYSYSPMAGYQNTSAGRIRSYSGSNIRRIELSSHYTSRNSPTPDNSFAYTSQPMTSAPSYAVSGISAPMGDMYRQDSAHGTEPFPQFSGVLGDVDGSAADGHSNDAGHPF